MDTLQMLALRRNTALGRLATLEKRAERLAAPAAPVVKTALAELSTALEEVQVASEQLQSQVDELMSSRQQLTEARLRMDELMDAMPFACVWTTREGEIDQANEAAAALLNVSAPRLVGRPLGLFMTERSQFNEALTALNEGIARAFELEAIIRPRERRARAVKLIARRLAHDPRHCWFLMENAAPAAARNSSE